jgi:hypothetical protein
VWALTEGAAGEDVGRELETLAARARTSSDPAFLGLVANSLINRGRTAAALDLLRTAAELQKDDGRLEAGAPEATREATALAVLGWLRANPGAFHDPARKAIRWLEGQQKDARGERSSMLALKAADAYTRAGRRSAAAAGELRLYIGDQAAARLPFQAGVADTLRLNLADAERLLKPGVNRVRVEVTGANIFPYTLSWSYQTQTPPSAPDCPLRLTARLDRTAAREGETVRLRVTLENVGDRATGPAAAVIGLPGGLALPEDLRQLRQHQRGDGRRALIDGFEVRGRELTLTWGELAPGQKVEAPVDLICRTPGVYRGPASRAYLAAASDRKRWLEPLQITIKARDE